MNYKKKDLKDIITKGSLKQRLNLWLNHTLYDSVGSPLLTTGEEEALFSTFKKNNEEALAFNLFENKKMAYVKTGLALDIARRTYRFYMARLTGFTSMLNAYEQTESILNDALYILGDDPKRKKVIEHIKTKQLSLATIIDSKDKGYIRVSTGGAITNYKKTKQDLINNKGDTDIDKGMYLEDVLMLEKIHTAQAMSEFKTCLTAIRDIAKEEGINSITHNKLHKEYEEEAKEYQGAYKGYNSKLMSNIPNINPRVKKILEKFNLYPNYEDLPIQKEYYTYTLSIYNDLVYPKGKGILLDKFQ